MLVPADSIDTIYSINWAQARQTDFLKTDTHTSHGDLTEYTAQFVKIHRLCKMEIEPGFSAALDIVTRGKTRQSYSLEGPFSFGFGNYVVTIPIRQGNIT